MGDLYDYEEVSRYASPDVDDDDDDEVCELQAFGVLASRKNKTSPAKSKAPLSANKRAKVGVGSSSSMKNADVVISVDDDDAGDKDKRTPAVAAPIAAKGKSSTEIAKQLLADFHSMKANEPIASTQIKQSSTSSDPAMSASQDERVRATMARLQSVKQNLLRLDLVEQAASQRNQGTAPAPSALNLPKIARAEARIVKPSAEVTIDLINGILGVVSTPSVIAPSVAPVISMNAVKLKTRLMQDEHLWSIDRSELMSKLRANVAAVYGLSVAEIGLSFDGDLLTDKSTAATLGLENEDLIEVKVPKAKITTAIAFAQSRPTTGKGKEEKEHKPEAAKIRLKTRMGTHEWLWRVDPAEPMRRLKDNFCAVYGLKTDEVVLSFDGVALQDGKSAVASGIEDQDLIEAKVAKAKVASAIAFAERNKSESNKEASQTISQTTSQATTTSATSSAPSSSSLADGRRTVTVSIDATLSVTNGDSQVSVTVLSTYTIRQLFDAIRAQIKQSAYALATEDSINDLDLDSTFAQFGPASECRMRVVASPLLDVIVRVQDPEEEEGSDIAVKAPKYQLCGVLMGRIAQAISVPVSELVFSCGVSDITEERLMCDVGVKQGSVIIVRSK